MRILLVEDEPDLRRNMARALEAAGFAVDPVEDGTEALRLGLQEPYDAIVLDLGLPGMDGNGVLARWREDGQQAPVLILTARSRWADKLAGFGAGADDYVTKPFDIEEVVLRLRALIRRSAGQTASVLKVGPVELDTSSGRVAVNGVPLQLTQQEFRILAYMMHHPGRVITRATLYAHVYDRHSQPESNVIDVLLARIRRKLSVNIIQTVRGQGYRLALPRA